MIKHYCDICGKLLNETQVVSDSDPLDYTYGSFRIEFDIKLDGGYRYSFSEICHECFKKIEKIKMDEFLDDFTSRYLGVKRATQ
jgi:hypothetical protein